jgi:hypothetical protein
LEPEKFKLSDILYGIVIPLLLVLLIAVLAIYVNPGGQFHVLGQLGIGGTIAVIFTQGFAQMIVLGVPMALGLLWNKWAGGAAGFLMGGTYYLASAGLYNGYYGHYGTEFYHNFYGDISMLFYLVNAIIIGYMAGALNNKSTNFKRMLGAGLTSTIITAVIQVFMNYNFTLDFAGGEKVGLWLIDYSPRNMAHGLWAVANTGIHDAAGTYIPFQYDASSIAYGFILAFVPSIALGVIVPIIAKVMTWYGLQPGRHQ